MATRVRSPGGGRKPLTETDPSLLDDLNSLVDPDACNESMSPLRRTRKSLRLLAVELNKLGHKISHTAVAELLKKEKSSLRSNRETREDSGNLDSDVEFKVINTAIKKAAGENEPVISADTKKERVRRPL